MTSVHLEGITVLADDVQALADFSNGTLGLDVTVREEHYVAFASPGIRFAIFSRPLMGAHAQHHPSFAVQRHGQAFELNFQCDSPSDVRTVLADLVERGAITIAEPVETEWGHFTGFFADPEGNIHSLFAVL